ncbi:MAG: cytochrome c peroxidase [Candidatus Palauibacterales bacterium]|nr:cytochrome c peroxidase [Candidatus Palauibacterales bacterium]MDP2530388.1 cytochrome c peroxidase [Candidatus Palauibacterales bacterium]MDP2585074.1 cytochrome c peroxidase [Candidatus Palauibacterales bacterium]
MTSDFAQNPGRDGRPTWGVIGRAAAFLLLFLAACSDSGTTAPDRSTADLAVAGHPGIATRVRSLATQRGITPMPAPPHVRPALARLGRALAFDPLLSGNRDISCMTCHLPELATDDGRSLAIGQGATGLGPERIHPEGTFIPRNAPPLFNLARLDHMFLDGRVEVDRAGKLHTPAGSQLTRAMTRALKFGAVSAQPMFPVVNRFEMRGQPGENELADVPDGDFRAVWEALMVRLGKIPEYRRMFEAAYPGQRFEDMTFAHASNAIAGFLVEAFSFDDAPWDRFLEGDHDVLTAEQLRGALDFMEAPCSTCHNGPVFSDDQFHDVALAQFGPGEGNGPTGRDDFGRMNVTGDPDDLYGFRTSPLRNVELTGPYGHAGQFAHLDDFIDHYSRNADKLRAYSDADVPEPLLRGTLVDNRDAVIAARSPFIRAADFDATFVREVTAFMRALTDDRARDLRRVIPAAVPSGLPVRR